MPETFTFEEAQAATPKSFTWEEAQPDHSAEIDTELAREASQKPRFKPDLSLIPKPAPLTSTTAGARQAPFPNLSALGAAVDQPLLTVEPPRSQREAFENSPNASEAVPFAIRDEMDRFATGLTKPSNLALMGGASLLSGFPILAKALQGVFGVQMAKQTAEQLGDLAGVPKEQRTPSVVAHKLTGAALSGAMTGLMAKDIAEPTPKPPEFVGPKAQGSILNMPPGAPVPPRRVFQMPEPEPTAADLGVTGVPGGGMPSIHIPDELLREKAPKPVVPATPPEPERGLTAIQEIRQRGLQTKAQIQAAFPHLSREQAATLRNQAWGMPPVPVPKEIAQTIVQAAPLLPKAAVEVAKAVTEPVQPPMKRQEAENVFGIDIPQGSMNVSPEKIEAALQAAADLTEKGETPNASSKQKTTEIHGSLRPQQESPGELPVQESQPGIQPQASGGIRPSEGTRTPENTPGQVEQPPQSAASASGALPEPTVPEPIPQTLRALQEKWNQQGVTLHLTHNDNAIQLGLIEVDPSKQGTGLGTAALNDVKGLADSQNKPVTLTALADKGKQADLERFYEANGFSKVGVDPLNGKPIYRYEPNSTPSESVRRMMEKKAEERAASTKIEGRQNEEPKRLAESKEPPVPESKVSGVGVGEVPVADLKLSEDVPNFKKGANDKGVVKPLGGQFDRRGLGPIQVWRRVDGTLEVISGRHRFDLAQRRGETSIPAQIYDESAGFTATDAATLDAELNIRDDQGEVSDYAQYFKLKGVTEAEAEARGLLARAKGKAGFSIAQNAGDDLFALHQDGRITNAQAEAIADAAPKEPGLQAVGLRAALDGKSAEQSADMVNLAKQRVDRRKAEGQQTDLFGFDDSAIREMEAQAKLAASERTDLRQRIQAIKGAAKNPELAKREGVNVKDPAAIMRKVGQLEQRIAELASHPELAGKVEPEPVKSAAKATPKGGGLFAESDMPFNLVAEKEAPARAVASTGYGDETLAQDEMFAISKITALKDPMKSAVAAEQIYGDKAAATIERQLRVMDTDPKVKKSFTPEQRQRLKEVVALLRQRQQGGPGIISMGGLAPGDPNEPVGKGGGNPDVYGIAARVRAEQEAAGTAPETKPGEGISAREAVMRGRAILAQDPMAAEKALQQFISRKSISADGMAAARAKGLEARQAARSIEQKFGTDSLEYQTAYEQASKWYKATKEMQTEWNRTGMAQQGEEDIDTGDFTALEMSYEEQTGKRFTPRQAKEAHEIADRNKAATDKVVEGTKAAGEEVKNLPGVAPDGTDLAAAKAQFGGYEAGKPMTPQQVKTLWNYVKAKFLDKFETDWARIRQGLAADFGLSDADIAKGLAQPKAVKKITDDLAVALSEQRRLKAEAKNWIKDQQYPGWLRTVRSIPQTLFNLSVFGHGTTWIGTHAPTQVFNPKAWSTLFPAYFKALKQMGLFLKDRNQAIAFHENEMTSLRSDPLYVKARKAGLLNDPHQFMDEYQNRAMEHLSKRFGLAGNMAWDYLKVFRQGKFNRDWNALSPSMQTDAYAQLLADSINTATGASRAKFGQYEGILGTTFFAPHLEASRWKWLIKDPAMAAKTFADWKNASLEERHAAIAEVRQKATIAAVYYGLLQMNQGMLKASGSDEKINFTDPRRLDFLAFKAAGQSAGIGTAMLSVVRLFANLYNAGFGQPRSMEDKLSSRWERISRTGGKYVRTKLSPFAQVGADVASQEDVMGNTMPWSSDVLPAYKQREGKHQLGYGEFAGEQFAPIPVSEAVREVFAAHGMNPDDQQAYLKALMAGAAAGTAGVRITQEPVEAKQR